MPKNVEAMFCELLVFAEKLDSKVLILQIVSCQDRLEQVL